MKRVLAPNVLILLSSIFINTCATKDDGFSSLAGRYLGQKLPGITPEVFAPGLVS